MKVYIDDILVKSTEEIDHVKDLEEAFNSLHRYQIKLNLRKCAFGMTFKKFLGFIITGEHWSKPRKDPSHPWHAALGIQKGGIAAY